MRPPAGRGGGGRGFGAPAGRSPGRGFGGGRGGGRGGRGGFDDGPPESVVGACFSFFGSSAWPPRIGRETPRRGRELALTLTQRQGGGLMQKTNLRNPFLPPVTASNSPHPLPPPTLPKQQRLASSCTPARARRCASSRTSRYVYGWTCGAFSFH